jgi:hypothetical protein
MAVATSRRVVVTDSQVKLTTDDNAGVARSLLLKNKTGSASVWLGGKTVDETTGYEWETTDGPIGIDVSGHLYAHAETDQTIHVLEVTAV